MKNIFDVIDDSAKNRATFYVPDNLIIAYQAAYPTYSAQYKGMSEL